MTATKATKSTRGERVMTRAGFFAGSGILARAARSAFHTGRTSTGFSPRT